MSREFSDQAAALKTKLDKVGLRQKVDVLPDPTPDAVVAQLRGEKVPLWVIYTGHGSRSPDGKSQICLKEGDLPLETMFSQLSPNVPHAAFWIDACESADADPTLAVSPVSLMSASYIRIFTEAPGAGGGSIVGNDLLDALANPPDDNNDGVITDVELFRAVNGLVSDPKRARDRNRRVPPAPKLAMQATAEMPLFRVATGEGAKDTIARVEGAFPGVTEEEQLARRGGAPKLGEPLPRAWVMQGGLSFQGSPGGRDRVATSATPDLLGLFPKLTWVDAFSVRAEGTDVVISDLRQPARKSIRLKQTEIQGWNDLARAVAPQSSITNSISGRPQERYAARVPASEVSRFRLQREVCAHDIGQCARVAAVPAGATATTAARKADSAIDNLRQVQNALKDFKGCDELPKLTDSVATLPRASRSATIRGITDSLDRRLEFIRCRCGKATRTDDCEPRDALWRRHADLQRRLDQPAAVREEADRALYTALVHEAFETALELFRRLPRNSRRWIEIRRKLQGSALRLAGSEELVPEILERWRRGEVTSKELDQLATNLEVRADLRRAASQNPKVLKGLLATFNDPSVAALRNKLEEMAEGPAQLSDEQALESAIDGIKYAVLVEIHRKFDDNRDRLVSPIRKHSLIVAFVRPPMTNVDAFTQEFQQLMFLGNLLEDGYTEPREASDAGELDSLLSETAKLLAGKQDLKLACSKLRMKHCQAQVAGIVGVTFDVGKDGAVVAHSAWRVRQPSGEIETGSATTEPFGTEAAPQKVKAFGLALASAKKITLLKGIDALFTETRRAPPAAPPPPPPPIVDKKRSEREVPEPPRIETPPAGDPLQGAAGLAFLVSGLPQLTDAKPDNNGLGWGLLVTDLALLSTSVVAGGLALKYRHDYSLEQEMKQLDNANTALGVSITALSMMVGERILNWAFSPRPRR